MDRSNGRDEEHWSEELDPASASRLLAALDDDEARAEAGEGPAAFPGYRVDRRIGEGGAGVVYRAFREGSDRPVAIKHLRQPLTRGDRSERAWRELQVLSQLRLPAVPNVLDYGVHEDRLFVVTDFVTGLDLAKHCEENDLTLRRRVELLARTAEAVQSLHEHGVIHRDVKPSNILVNPHGQPMIIDLGLASVLTGDPMETLLAEGVPVGSPAFMSPEQADGRRGDISTRSDVYGLGATAYVILTGAPPHEMAQTLGESIRRVSQDQPRQPRTLAPAMPRDLAAVLSKAVSRQARERYATAQELAEDLQRWLRGEAVQARRRSAWRRATAWAGRHPVAIPTSLGLVIALSLVGSSLLTRWWLDSLPSYVHIAPDESSVAIYTASGKLLRRWDTEAAGRVYFAEILERPRQLGGGRVLLLGLESDRHRSSGYGDLTCYAVSDLQTPLWSSEGTIQLPDALRYATEGDAADEYLVRRVMLEDVFPESPGREIIALHRHRPYSPAAIRVYDFAGRVLYEVWQDGHLSDVHWAPGARLLVATGRNSDGRWEERGAEAQDAIYPTVVFAVEPRLQDHADVLSWTDFQGTVEPAWYYCVWPPELSSFFAGGQYEFVEAPGRRYDPLNQIQFSISTDTDTQAGYNWIISADGTVVDHYETAGWEQEEELPDADLVKLAPLPPRTTPRE